MTMATSPETMTKNTPAASPQTEELAKLYLKSDLRNALSAAVREGGRAARQARLEAAIEAAYDAAGDERTVGLDAPCRRGRTHA